MSVLLDYTSDEYHSDPSEVPSLNSTTARLLLSRTPAHAKAQHPRLTETVVHRESDAMDMGTAVHQLLLKDDRVALADFPDFRSKEARLWRDGVRANKQVPLLRHKWEEAQRLAVSIRQQMSTLPKPTPFTAGTPEATIVWEDTGGAWCRARMDWLRDDLETIDDLKCTSRSADPKVWERQLFSMGYDVQAALYIRGVEKTLGKTPRFRWVIAETYPPFAVSVVELSEPDMFAASVKVETAISVWNECMAADHWPAYDVSAAHIAHAPAWAKQQRDAWSDVDLEAVPF